jgi:O-antigen/teichoic acid export membrane protein
VKILAQPRALKTDLLLTAITQFAVMAGTFFVYGMISRFFSAKGVGEYALIRRALYFLQPVALLGITVAVPKFLPMHREKAERTQIAAIGFAIVMGGSILIALIMIFRKDWFAVLIFGDPNAHALVASFAAIAIAFGFHSYVYSYFRGMLNMNSANSLDLMNSMVLPLVAVAVCAHSTLSNSILVLAATTALWTAIAARPLWREIWEAKQEKYCKALTKSLLRYGLPRIPGDFALAGLLLGAPWVVAQSADLAEAGRFAIAQTILVVPGAGLAALGIVLLPYVSERLADGDFQSVKTSSVNLFHAILDNSIYFGLHVFIMADVIVRLWVGQSMIGAKEFIRILIIVVPFHVTYFVFRSVIDATTVKPATTINLVIAFGTFAGCYALLKQVGISAGFAAAFSLATAYFVLGILTFIVVTHYYGMRGFFDRETSKIILLNIFIAGSIFTVRSLFSIGDMACITIEIMALIIYSAVIMKMKRAWATMLFRTVGISG